MVKITSVSAAEFRRTMELDRHEKREIIKLIYKIASKKVLEAVSWQRTKSLAALLRCMATINPSKVNASPWVTGSFN